MNSKSKVFFIDLKAEEHSDNLTNKIIKLYDAANFDSILKKGDLTAIKTHFGEMGNSTFIPPWNIQPIVKRIKKMGGKPFLTDTNTLYNYARKNAVDHIRTANSHGYNLLVTGAPIIIADGLLGRDFEEVEIKKKHFDKVKIASSIAQADSMIVSSHFKGHHLAGFGGAIKNIGMGCASVEGKKEQHTTRPFSDHKLCTGCGICAEVCPVNAIQIIKGKSIINSDVCIGCGECIAHCPEKAIELDWKTEIEEFTERLTEYALGTLKTIGKEKIGFINFLMNITPECDCFSYSQRPIVADIGILVSKDPVAIDKACFDLVNQQIGNKNSILTKNFEPGKNKFQGLSEESLGEIQLTYGNRIGLGNLEYELIKIN